MKNELKRTLNWEVEQQELQTGNVAIKGKYVLQRNDTGAILNICSDHYKPFYNYNLLRLVDDIEKISSFKLMGFEEFRKGGRILAFLKNDKPGVLGGEKVEDFLIIGNSHNSSSKVFAGMSNYMIRCENQFSGDLYSLRIKHINGQNEETFNPQIIVNNYYENRKHLDQQVNGMMNTELNWDEASRYIDRLIDEIDPIETEINLIQKPSTRKREILDSVHREMNDLGNTVWGFYNGITFYTSNILKGKSGFGITNGIGERINRLAWECSQRKVNRGNF